MSFWQEFAVTVAVLLLYIPVAFLGAYIGTSLALREWRWPWR